MARVGSMATSTTGSIHTMVIMVHFLDAEQLPSPTSRATKLETEMDIQATPDKNRSMSTTPHFRDAELPVVVVPAAVVRDRG
jgi:hypothetical protein